MSSKILHFLKTLPRYWWLAAIITIAGGFLRFHRIPETVMFLGDQGRDALIVARMFREFNPVFIGPVTSVGNMYLGPFYYYFMLPFLWLSYPSPLGPVYAVAFFSTLTIFITYLVGKKMFSDGIGIMAAFFMAFSAEAVDISRFSWNPNLAPLFSILMIYFSWKALSKPKNWIIVALLFSLIIQLHYLTLLTGATVGLLWLGSTVWNFKKKPLTKRASFIKENAKIVAACLGVFVLSLVPQILFDLKHGGLNIQAFGNMFAQEEIFTDKKASSFIETTTRLAANFRGRANHILIRVHLGRLQPRNETILLVLFLILILLAFHLAYSSKKTKELQALLVVVVFFLMGAFGTALYQHELYNHYIAYLYPVAALIIAISLGSLMKIRFDTSLPLVLLCLVWFGLVNARNWPIKPNYLYLRTQETSDQVYELINPGESYEIVLLSETKDLYGQSYRWFLSTTDRPPVVKEKQEMPEALVIIDEEKNVDDVTSLDIYEVLIFPHKNVAVHIVNEDLPDIYLLRQSKNQL